MPEFSIKGEEIQNILQLSKLQGGSVYRQKDIYEALDRVIARGPMPEHFAEKTIICPYCYAENIFEVNQVVMPCKKCGRGLFRRV